MRIEDRVLFKIFRDGLTAPEVKKTSEIWKGVGRARPKTMRLMKLTLENFRAFRGETTFDFNGRNVLVYGENGSGKTSVWSALDLFLGAALAKDEKISRDDFRKQHYQFNRAPGSVRFESLDELGILEDIPRTETFVWSRDESPYQNPAIAPAARIRACLDYRALWETYFLHRKKDQVDIWPLLIGTLIPHVETIGSVTVLNQWEQICSLVSGDVKETVSPFGYGDSTPEADEALNDYLIDHMGARPKDDDDVISTYIDGFNSDLEFVLGNIFELANRILKVLSEGLTFKHKLVAAKEKPKLKQPKVILTVSLNNKPLRNHHNLLNEARLSALALSIYLAAAKINAAPARSGFKILALDDVLIGLDMSNRLPVLDVLEGWFPDWQVFLFTYDRAWYELAKSRLDKDKWKKFEFFASDDVPVWNEDLDYLNKAEFYLKTAQEFAGLSEPVRVTPDYRAAGVYARTAFEMALKRFFFKHEVPVVYQLDPKHMLGDLWPVMQKLESNIGEERGPILSRELCRDIETYTKSNLNPLCHSGFFHSDRREVLKALAAVKSLQDELARPHKKVAVKVETPAPVIDFDVNTLSDAQLGTVLGEIKEELKARNQAKAASKTS